MRDFCCRLVCEWRACTCIDTHIHDDDAVCAEGDSRHVPNKLQGAGDKTGSYSCAVTVFTNEMGANRWRLNLAKGPSRH